MVGRMALSSETPAAMTTPAAATPLIFVTGGVVSSLGKGITAASLAAILEARGLKVTIPARPFVGLSTGDRSVVREMISRFVAERLGAEGG